jgi:hypothetical protein
MSTVMILILRISLSFELFFFWILFYGGCDVLA